MIDTTSDQAKKIITKDLNNWNSNFWRLRCREQVIKLEISKLLLRSSNFLHVQTFVQNLYSINLKLEMVDLI